MKWSKVKLGETATFVNGYAFKPSDWSEQGKEIIRIQNLTKSAGEVNRFKGELASRYLVKRGDLLISWSATLGIYEWEGEDAWLNQHIFKVVFDKMHLDKRFFKYLIESKLHELERHVHGATMKHITKDKFDNISVHIPPIHIQQQIADTLDKADALCRKDQELLQKYDELAQSIFYDMFGDPARNEWGWEIVSLPQLYPKQREGTKCGPFGSALKKEEYVSTGVPVWVMDNIVGDEFNPTGCLYITEEKHRELSGYSVRPNDIIISRAGTVGKMCTIPPNMPLGIISTNLIRLSLDGSKVHPQFFVKLMSYFGPVIGRLKTGGEGAFTHMNTGVLNSLTFALPPIDKQCKYVAALEVIKQQRSLISHGKSGALFTALLSQRFS